MGKGKEARSERINVSLRPSTLAVLERLSAATGVPVPGIIAEQIEMCEGVFAAGATIAEKSKAAREKAARQQEEQLRKLAKGAL